MKYKYQVIGCVLAAIDLLVYSVIIHMAQIVCVVQRSEAGARLADIMEYIPTASTVIFIIVFLIAAAIGIALPYQIEKQK